jgi:DNA replication protein DnaC
MKAEAIRFASDMLANCEPRWLSMLGTSGAGKTMLAKSINRVFRKCLDGTRLSESPTLVAYRKGGFKAWVNVSTDLRNQDYEGFHRLRGDWFVVIDDIGSEHSTDFISGKLYELLNARENKWTVITANLSLDDIEQKIDARIASRMIRHGSTVVDVNVQDFNLR